VNLVRNDSLREFNLLKSSLNLIIFNRIMRHDHDGMTITVLKIKPQLV